MNWRFLIPCGSLLAGALTGWLLRAESAPPPAATGAGTHPPPVAARAAAPASESGTARRPAIHSLRELFALWGPAGTADLYEQLEGTPAKSMAAWLEELRPPESQGLNLHTARRDEVRDALVARLAERDPAALAAWLLKVPPGCLNSSWTKIAAEALLQQGTPEAGALLTKLEKSDNTVRAARLLWLTEHDPEAALRQVLAEPGIALPAPLAEWLAADPARAQALANEHPDKCFALLAVFAGQGRAALEQFAAGLTHPEAQTAARQLQLTAAARAGDAAAFSALLLRDGRIENRGQQDTAMQLLASLHPDITESTIRQLTGTQPGLAKLLFYRLSVAHPERAVAMLSGPELPGITPSVHEWSSRIPAIADAWSVSDPAAAQAWLRGLPEERRVLALPHCEEITDDLSIAEWVSLTRGLPLNYGQAQNLMQQMVEHTTDPAVVAEWCASFSDEARKAMLSRLPTLTEDKTLVDKVTQLLQPPSPAPQ